MLGRSRTPRARRPCSRDDGIPLRGGTRRRLGSAGVPPACRGRASARLDAHCLSFRLAAGETPVLPRRGHALRGARAADWGAQASRLHAGQSKRQTGCAMLWLSLSRGRDARAPATRASPYARARAADWGAQASRLPRVGPSARPDAQCLGFRLARGRDARAPATGITCARARAADWERRRPACRLGRASARLDAHCFGFRLAAGETPVLPRQGMHRYARARAADWGAQASRLPRVQSKRQAGCALLRLSPSRGRDARAPATMAMLSAAH